MTNETYKRLLVMSSKLAFRVTVDWTTNVATVTPRGISRGGELRVDLSMSPEKAAKAFGSFYGMSSQRVAELQDPSEMTLTRRPRVSARSRVGRSQQEEQSNGKESRKE